MKQINPFDQSNAMTFGSTLDVIIDDAPGLRNCVGGTAVARRMTPQT